MDINRPFSAHFMHWVIIQHKKSPNSVERVREEKKKKLWKTLQSYSSDKTETPRYIFIPLALLGFLVPCMGLWNDSCSLFYSPPIRSTRGKRISVAWDWKQTMDWSFIDSSREEPYLGSSDGTRNNPTATGYGHDLLSWDMSPWRSVNYNSNV